MVRLIAAVLMGLAIARTESLFAKDYVLKLEWKAEIETKVGHEMSKKTSDLRTVEVLVASKRPFHVKTTSGQESLSLDGQVTETKEGKFNVEIDCRHLSAGNSNRTKCKTTIVVTPCETVVLGGMATNETFEASGEIRNIKKKLELRMTLIEEEPEDASVE